ncbi:MAG: NYN domain-containing protein [Endomicrobia bacterium]|nr:NYN domain-containing protein [Endomicrobiia bacterium]
MFCYILDGYNIIKQSEKFAAKDLFTQRNLLIKFLIKHKPQGSYKNKVIIVFDGNPDVQYRGYNNLKNYNIEIIFNLLLISQQMKR